MRTSGPNLTAIENAKRELFSSGLHVYAILDGALVEGLEMRLEREAAHYVCLYRGKVEPWLRRVAPFLVRLEQDSTLINWIFTTGWGNRWGIFLRSHADLKELRRHFRKFLLVKIPNEPDLIYFRFYDPRVISVFLPTCETEELISLFGPISNYICEDEMPELREIRVYSLEQSKLIAQKIKI